jgi:septal ring factor EnvC (AmiA/AmiB activator)
MADKTRRDTGNNKANEISVEHANLDVAADAASLCAEGSGLVVQDSSPITEGSGRIVDLHARGDHADELSNTAEFPVLVLNGELCDVREGEEAEREKTQPALVASPVAHERASFWLQHLESDVQRLQSKWQSVAVEIRVRDTAIHELRSQVEARDVLLGDLRRQIDEQRTARLDLETELDQADARIADLIAAQDGGELNLAQAEADLQEAREVAALAQANVAALVEEKASLNDAVDRHAEAAADAQRRYENEARRASDLRARVEELEAYIDGSKERWSALNDDLAEYRDGLAASERREAEAVVALMAETKARERLSTEAAALERRLEELGGQLGERETAHRELMGRLEEERAAATQLRADLASATARADRALGELSARDERVVELERLVLARDETIAGLEERLRERERSETELLAQKDDLAGRVAALERNLSQRQDELRLAVEVGAEQEREFQNAQQKITRLEGLLREAANEINKLVVAIEARETTISRLEVNLRARQDAVEVLERSVRRLADIGTSIDGLDRLLVPTANETAGTHVLPRSERQAAALLPDPNGAEAPSRKMVIAIDGDDQTTYPLRKGEVTIGRSDASDIQIRRPFVSRMHARIVTHDSVAYIEDVGSRNGIAVNSKTVDRRAELHDGDVINLGESLKLRYVDLDCRREPLRVAGDGRPDSAANPSAGPPSDRSPPPAARARSSR